MILLATTLQPLFIVIFALVQATVIGKKNYINLKPGVMLYNQTFGDSEDPYLNFKLKIPDGYDKKDTHIIITQQHTNNYNLKKKDGTRYRKY
jgi:hypothetical protein